MLYLGILAWLRAVSKISLYASEYGQEMPQSHAVDEPTVQ